MPRQPNGGEQATPHAAQKTPWSAQSRSADRRTHPSDVDLPRRAVAARVVRDAEVEDVVRQLVWKPDAQGRRRMQPAGGRWDLVDLTATYVGDELGSTTLIGVSYVTEDGTVIQ